MDDDNGANVLRLLEPEFDEYAIVDNPEIGNPSFDIYEDAEDSEDEDPDEKGEVPTKRELEALVGELCHMDRYYDVEDYKNVLVYCQRCENDHQKEICEQFTLENVSVHITRGAGEGNIRAQFTLPPLENRPRLAIRVGQEVELYPMNMLEENVVAKGRVIEPPKCSTGIVIVKIDKKTSDHDAYDTLYPNNDVRLYKICWVHDNTPLIRVFNNLTTFVRICDDSHQGKGNKVRYIEPKTKIPTIAMDPKGPQLSSIIRNIMLKGEFPKIAARPIYRLNENYDWKAKSRLNPNQIEACKGALTNPLYIVQGPPGCGKTTTAVALIDYLINQDKRVLVVAPSNVAVDHLLRLVSAKYPHKCIRLCSMTHDFGNKDLEAFSSHKRIFEPSNFRGPACPPGFVDLFEKMKHTPLDKKESRRYLKLQNNFERNLMRDIYQVSFMTNCGAGDRKSKKVYWDHIIQDESTQDTEALSLIPFNRALISGQITLFGDHMQLGPVIMNDDAKNKNFEFTMFERLLKIGVPMTMLNEQYRMHPHLSSLTNNIFYDGKLKNGVSIAERQHKEMFDFWPDNRKPAGFFCVTHEEVRLEQSIANLGEVEVIGQIVKCLITERNIRGHEIACIAGYSAQIVQILDEFDKISKTWSEAHKHEIQKIKPATVTGFQGQERNFIIFSICRSNRKRMIGFLESIQRLNVATSRSKYALFVVGNPTMFNPKKHPKWEQLLNWFYENETMYDGFNFEQKLNKDSFTQFPTVTEIAEEIPIREVPLLENVPQTALAPVPFFYQQQQQNVGNVIFQRVKASGRGRAKVIPMVLPIMVPPGPFPEASMQGPSVPVKETQVSHREIRFRRIKIVDVDYRTRICFVVDSDHFGALYGIGGVTIRKITEEFGVRIFLPSIKMQKVPNALCSITASTHENRVKALQSIEKEIHVEYLARSLCKREMELPPNVRNCGKAHYWSQTLQELEKDRSPALRIQNIRPHFIHMDIRHDIKSELLQDKFCERMKDEFNQLVIVAENGGEFYAIKTFTIKKKQRKLSNEQVIQKIREHVLFQFKKHRQLGDQAV